MAKAKATTRGVNLPVPQSDPDAEALIRRIGELNRTKTAEKIVHDKEIAKLEEAFATRQKELSDEVDVATEALNIWASAHRDRLTNGGKTKTVQLATGEIQWRDGKASVTFNGKRVSKAGAEVLPALRLEIAKTAAAVDEAAAGGDVEPLYARHATLRGFIRVTVSLNKEAMHDAQDVALTVPGIAFTKPGESFEVLPLGSQIAETP